MISDPILLSDWHPVARVEDVIVNKPFSAQLLEEDLVLWRSKGKLMAWKDLCIHRGARLSQGQINQHEGSISCPYHGWKYNTEGNCIHIPAHPEQTPPARAQAQIFHVQERYGLIWVCLGESNGDIPLFPEWDDPTYRKVLCGPYIVEAAAPRLIENFLDVSHFPFVHTGLLGSSQRPEIADYEASITPSGVVARDVRIWQPDPDGSGSGAVSTYTYCAFRPLTAYFTKTSNGPRFAAYFPVTPNRLLKSTGWLWLALNYRSDASDDELRGFEDAIMSQDIPVVESQRPELLPLDLQEELHLRSDRTAIAYRKWLRQLGLKFGTF